MESSATAGATLGRGWSDRRTVDATMDDVARAAGVSRSLVSLVFQDSPKVAPSSRAKVLAAAGALGYRPNALARSLASKQVRTVGVLLNDISNPFFAAVYDALAECAETRGYSILLGAGQRSSAREREIVAGFLSHRVGGLILVSPRMSVSSIEELTSGLPSVLVGRDVRLRDVDTITNDEMTGARAALGHLVSLGHRDIAHVSGGKGAGAAERRAAYTRGMTERGLAEYVRVVVGDFTEQSGETAARQLITSGALPTAVLAANDMIAVGMMGVFQDAGIDVPSDISIVGYDNLTLSSLSMISLTSVAQPLADFGRAAMELLLERVDGARTTRVRRQFEPALIVRGSTGAVGPRPSIPAR